MVDIGRQFDASRFSWRQDGPRKDGTLQVPVLKLETEGLCISTWPDIWLLCGLRWPWMALVFDYVWLQTERTCRSAKFWSRSRHIQQEKDETGNDNKSSTGEADQTSIQSISAGSSWRKRPRKIKPWHRFGVNTGAPNGFKMLQVSPQ